MPQGGLPDAVAVPYQVQYIALIGFHSTSCVPQLKCNGHQITTPKS